MAAFPAELRQVFTNLITNAAEAASPGGQVKVSIQPAGTAGTDATGQKMQAGATVTIADNGPGIPAEVRPHLFQPFFTTKGERGTGLGLWVSRGIINKHGGTISLKSDTSARGAHGTVVQRLSSDESNDQHRPATQVYAFCPLELTAIVR